MKTATDRPEPDARDRIVAATQKLLAAKGIRALTVAEVADAAGMSRAWLYRQFPDKQSMVGAAIVAITDAFWTNARAELEKLDSFADQMIVGVRVGRGAYDDPGPVLIRLQLTEPEEYAACIGPGVAGLIPGLAQFWRPFVDAAITRGDIAPGHDPAETAEWVARLMISIGTTPSTTLNPDNPADVSRHIHHYVMPALASDPG